MIAKMRNGGEACTAANRFFVQAGIADEFADRLTEAMNGLTMGPGYIDGTTLGPLVNATTRDKVAALVDQARRHRRRAAGPAGRFPTGAGYFYPPTVLTGVAADAEILQTEIFGPVAPIVTFDDRGGGDRAGQQHRVRPGLLRLHR